MLISGCKLLTRNARPSSVGIINTEAETQVNKHVYRASLRGKLGSEKGERKKTNPSLIRRSGRFSPCRAAVRRKGDQHNICCILGKAAQTKIRTQMSSVSRLIRLWILNDRYSATTPPEEFRHPVGRVEPLGDVVFPSQGSSASPSSTQMRSSASACRSSRW